MADELKVSVRVEPDMSGVQGVINTEAKRLANHPIEIPADVKLNVAAIRETLEKWAKGFNGSIALPVELTQNLSEIKEAAVEIRNTLQKNIGSIDVDINTDTAKKTIKKTIRKSSVRRPRLPSPEQKAQQVERANQKYYDKQTYGVVGRLKYAAQSGRNKLAVDDANNYVKNVLNPIQVELDKIRAQGTSVTEEQKANIANLVSDARQALRTLQAEQAAAVKAANAEPKESDLVKRADKLHKDLIAQKELVTNGERKLTDVSEYNEAWDKVEEKVNAIRSGNIVDPDEVTRTEAMAKNLDQVYKDLYAKEHPKATNADSAEPKKSELVKRADKLHKDLVAKKELVTNGERKLADASEYIEAWDKIEAKVEAIRSGNIVDPDEVTRTEAMAKNLEQIYKDLYAKEHPKEPKPSTENNQSQRDQEQYAKNLKKIVALEEKLVHTKDQSKSDLYKAQIRDLENLNDELLDAIVNQEKWNLTQRQRFKTDQMVDARKGFSHQTALDTALADAQKQARLALDGAAKLGGGYDVELFSDLQKRLEAIGNTKTNVTVVEINELNIAVEKLLENLTKVKADKAMPVSRTEVDALKASFEDLGRNWSKLFTDANLSSKYSEVLKKIDTSSTVAEFNEAKQAVKAFKAEVVSAGKNTVSWADRMGSAVKTLTRYWSINEIFMTMKRVMGQMITQVVELDAKVTDLQIASGKSRNEVKAMVRDYAAMGKELGATATAMAEAADTFLRQGMSVAETNQLITDTMYLSKLGQIDAAEASTALTSSLNGYQLAAEDAIDVVDKLTAVDAVSASSAGGLAISLAETATSARLAGVSFDQLIGYTATVKEVTQDADESVGRKLPMCTVMCI